MEEGSSTVLALASSPIPNPDPSWKTRGNNATDGQKERLLRRLSTRLRRTLLHNLLNYVYSQLRSRRLDELPAKSTEIGCQNGPNHQKRRGRAEKARFRTRNDAGLTRSLLGLEFNTLRQTPFVRGQTPLVTCWSNLPCKPMHHGPFWSSTANNTAIQHFADRY